MPSLAAGRISSTLSSLAIAQNQLRHLSSRLGVALPAAKASVGASACPLLNFMALACRGFRAGDFVLVFYSRYYRAVHVEEDKSWLSSPRFECPFSLCHERAQSGLDPAPLHNSAL